MSKDIVHVYLMPGMAANPTIFEYIKLPQDQFEVHWLEWMLPLDNSESISDYARRMTRAIKHNNIVLLGVSFGGVLVQEMSRHIKVKKLIIVSSIKSMNELPRHMQLAKKTKAYKLVPTHLVGNFELLAKYAFGSNVKKRVDLYKKYLSVSDDKYLSWAIKEILYWNQKEPPANVIHIHGDKDAVFPIKKITQCITIKNGTHIMIINKYKWFNENLPSLILEN